MGVEVAGLGDGVQDGARVGVGPLFEELGLSLVGAEQTRGRVAGEEGGEVGAGGSQAGFNADAEVDRGLGQAFTEALGVQRGDLEDAVTALGAAGAADQMGTRAGDGGGKGGVDDLDEGLGGHRASLFPTVE